MLEVFEALEQQFANGWQRIPLKTWEWPGLDEDLKDLVLGLTRLDPRRQLTAQQALEHPWFHDD